MTESTVPCSVGTKESAFLGKLVALELRVVLVYPIVLTNKHNDLLLW